MDYIKVERFKKYIPKKFIIHFHDTVHKGTATGVIMNIGNERLLLIDGSITYSIDIKHIDKIELLKDDTNGNN